MPKGVYIRKYSEARQKRVGQPLGIRFMSKVILPETENGCWIWTGAKRSNGYGGIWVDRVMRPAHAVALHLFNNKPVDCTKKGTGLNVDHLCKNTLCVNPKHLEIVSAAENVRRGDGLAAVNFKKTHCSNGHEFSIDNTRIIVSRGSQSRQCKTCARKRTQEWRKRNDAK